MTVTSTAPVLAAGAVCWRFVDGKVRVLLVHRTQHKDVSLPKGKVDPGETLPQTAVREIAEETGLAVSLSAPLGQVQYQLANGRDKVVYYWSAEVDAHALEAARFKPNDEISALEWVSLTKARTRLTYPHDVDVIDAFAERVRAGRARTFAVIVLRHGKAVPRGSWDGPDATRPLLTRGTAQAEGVAAGIAAYKPTKLVTSTAVRCVATIAPTASLTGIPVKETDAISQDAWEAGQSGVAPLVAKRLRRGDTVVLCSHGPVIPDIIREIATYTNTPRSSDFESMGDLATGEFSVIHVATDDPTSGVVAMETHAPAE